MEDQGAGGQRQFPQALEAERAVLGALILDPHRTDAIAAILDLEDFYSDAHKRLFALLVGHANAGQTVDLLGIVQEVMDADDPKEFGGVNYVASLPELVPTTENVEYYARIVVDKARRRRLLTAAGEIVERAFGGSDTTEDLLDFAEGQVFAVTQLDNQKEWQTIAEIADVEWPAIERRAADPGEVVGVPTGFTQLDRLLAGLHNTDLVILAARPAMGKTALALNIAQNAALKANVGVGFFSLEMGAAQLWTRMLCSVGRVEGNKIRTGQGLNEDDWDRLGVAADQLYQAPIWIDDTPGLTVHQLRSRARRLKGLAKDLDVAVMALSQLNRGLESRTDKRPMPSDLRESGAIEQDADVIMFIYRDEVYNRETAERGVAEVIVAKQRRGATGDVKLAWNGPTTTFDNLELRYDGYE